MKKEFKVGQHWRCNRGNKWRILATDCPLYNHPILALGPYSADAFDEAGESSGDRPIVLEELWVEVKHIRLLAWLRSEPGNIQWTLCFQPDDWQPTLEDDQGQSPYRWKRAAWLDEK